jgi:NADH-quinone oxidoreductase subunit G
MFKLDGVDIPFEPGETLISAAAKKGIEIPHYCWHPGLSAPANCRMCLVEILPKPGMRPLMLDVLELDSKTGEYKPAQKPKLVPACQFPAAEGLEVKADTSPHVVQARKAVQESLLLNHPVDCPICDQSGECKLQDYWLEHGKFSKRLRDEPVHKPKAVVFGPTMVYDAERCVLCTRCIRVMGEIAKDPVLGMRERGNLNEISVAPGRQLDGHYTLMTEHVCPVGALTSQDFRFKARVWFLRTASSVCQGCATGCNAHLDYDPRYNKAFRYRPRENHAVNKYWMCDEGMLSYRQAHEGRITEARVNGKTSTVPAALEAAAKLFEGGARASIAVVFSAQHSLEDNWALAELANTFGTTLRFWSGKGDGDQDAILRHADKNPNTAGVRGLVPEAKPLSALLEAVQSGTVHHVLALGGMTAEAIIPAGIKLITVAAHDGSLAQAATVLLPATSWAEQSGTYVTAKGVRQVSEKALEPLGASRPAWEQLAALGKALGVEVSWTKLRAIRSQLTASLSEQAPLAS